MANNEATQKPPLTGLKVLELAGTVIGPFTGMVLADLGCDVVRIDPPSSKKNSPWIDSLCRRKSSVVVDFASPSSLQAFFDLLTVADILIDPYRPGAFERSIGMNAEELCRQFPRLVYARINGFAHDDQTYSHAVGHEGNYIAVSGGLPSLQHMRGKNGVLFKPTTNYLADFGPGSMACIVGILCALMQRSVSGRGQVVDASVQQGTAYMSIFPRQRREHAEQATTGEPSLDTDHAPYYDIYRLDPAVMPGRDDRSNWPALREVLGEKFASETQKHWRSVFDGANACVSPILDFDDAGVDLGRPLVQLSETPSLPIPKEHGIPSLGLGEGSADACRRWLGKRTDLVIDSSSFILKKNNGRGLKSKL
ncbi:CoA-transferase family III domain-containing protein [Talaromyces proteolyticus]|uniref:CoA-transferase family III domain-containing protein n=1 Tax=Talaromyces proteolyticus TaxID=1131652 RepID=A0AAD4KHX8_9EURO|nr:CoA-transferase family III domain-containing protein [Talaromyces proteolyticus]KAH8688825.1 CoA-transferase family III domain-containing protein [Talaromyces proteolyticus]